MNLLTLKWDILFDSELLDTVNYIEKVQTIAAYFGQKFSFSLVSKKVTWSHFS